MPEFPIYSPEDQERLEDLFTEAQKARGESLIGLRRLGDGDDGSSEDATRAYNAFLAEARERTPILVLAPLGRKEWRALAAQHPARDENKDDENIGGFNEETWPEALILHPGTITEVLHSDRSAQVLVDSLSHGKFTSLYNDVYHLNTGLAIDPKELPLSARTTSNDAT